MFPSVCPPHTGSFLSLKGQAGIFRAALIFGAKRTLQQIGPTDEKRLVWLSWGSTRLLGRNKTSSFSLTAAECKLKSSLLYGQLLTGPKTRVSSILFSARVSQPICWPLVSCNDFLTGDALNPVEICCSAECGVKQMILVEISQRQTYNKLKICLLSVIKYQSELCPGS